MGLVPSVVKGRAKSPLGVCARRMCEGDEEGWLIPSWADDLRQILSNALSGGDAEAREAASSPHQPPSE